MTRFADKGKRLRFGAAAFTLMEVMLVIVLLMLVAGMIGLWVQRSLFATGDRPPQEVFLVAAKQARILAAQQGHPVLLSFDEAAQGFRLSVLDADNPFGVAADSDLSLPWLEQSGLRRVKGTTETPLRATAETVPGQPDAAEASPQADSRRFFALPEGSRLRVTFYLLYGEETVALPAALEGIRYHPSGASTPAQVQLEDTATGFRQTLLPDSLSGGLRMDEQGHAPTGSTKGGWR